MIKTNIPLPRLLDAKTLAYKRSIRPVKVSLDLDITPLSYASIELPEDESLPTRSYVELFNAIGSAGIYRVRAPQNSYGDMENSVAELEHAVTEVGDWLVLTEYDEMMDAAGAMVAIFGQYRGKFWQMGPVDILGHDAVSVSVDHESVLSAMLSVLSQVPDCMMTFNFNTKPWTINFAKRGKAVAAEGRLSRNIDGVKITYDDSALCTRCYYEYEYTNSDDETETAWAYIDADTIKTWGQIEKTASTSGCYFNEASWIAQNYINNHKNPKFSAEITAEILSGITGESLDAFAIGKLCRLALDRYNLTISECITHLTWDDVYGAPLSVTVTLGQEEDTAVSFLHDVSTTGESTSASSSGSSSTKKSVWKAFSTEFEKTDRYMDLYAKEVDKANNILKQAGLYIDAKGVIQYASDNVNQLYSKIKTSASEVLTEVKSVKDGLTSQIKVAKDSISQVVKAVGKDGKVTAASIVAAVNNAGSSVKINADRIKLTGDTTINDVFKVTGTYLYIKKMTMFDNGSDLVTISGTGIAVHGQWLNVANVTKDGNVLTITYVDGSTETFSKATTQSGAWSGGNYTVTAKQNGATVGTNVAQIKQLYTSGNVSVLGSYVGQIVSVYATENGAGNQSVYTGFQQEVWIDASGVDMKTQKNELYCSAATVQGSGQSNYTFTATLPTGRFTRGNTYTFWRVP